MKLLSSRLSFFFVVLVGLGGCLVPSFSFTNFPSDAIGTPVSGLTTRTPSQHKKMSEADDTGGSEDEVVGQMRGGLLFVRTKDRESIVKFYQDKIGMKVWLEQPDITILSLGNLVIGFHNRPDDPPGGADSSTMFTFVYPTRQEVDAMHEKFKDDPTTDGPPRDNSRYRIYQFFAKDPEGRQLEFQAFLHPLEVVSSALDS